jgi:hypothetical protein
MKELSIIILHLFLLVMPKLGVLISSRYVAKQSGGYDIGKTRTTIGKRCGEARKMDLPSGKRQMVL